MSVLFELSDFRRIQLSLSLSFTTTNLKNGKIRGREQFGAGLLAAFQFLIFYGWLETHMTSQRVPSPWIGSHFVHRGKLLQWSRCNLCVARAGRGAGKLRNSCFPSLCFFLHLSTLSSPMDFLVHFKSS